MFILAWLAKIGIGGILGQLAQAYKAKQQAQTDQAKIAADERIANLNAIRDVQVAEAGSPINAIIRAFIAIGPAGYLFKIFAIDKLICPVFGGACATDQLSPELWNVMWIVLGFYFLHSAITTTARIIKR